MKKINSSQHAGGFNREMGRYRAQLIKDLFAAKKIDSILDIGSGPADVIKILDQISPLVRKSKLVTLVDANQNYLKTARKLYGRNRKFQFINSWAEDLDLANKYDLIIMIDILEHLASPLAVLKKIKKYLNRGGFVLAVVPNAKSLHRRIGKEIGFIKSYYELGAIDFKVGHKRCFDSQKLAKLVNRAGFKIIHQTGILLKPFPNKQMIKFPRACHDFLYQIGKEIREYCGEIAFVLSNK